MVLFVRRANADHALSELGDARRKLPQCSACSGAYRRAGRCTWGYTGKAPATRLSATCPTAVCAQCSRGKGGAWSRTTASPWRRPMARGQSQSGGSANNRPSFTSCRLEGSPASRREPIACLCAKVAAGLVDPTPAPAPQGGRGDGGCTLPHSRRRGGVLASGAARSAGSAQTGGSRRQGSAFERARRFGAAAGDGTSRRRNSHLGRGIRSDYGHVHAPGVASVGRLLAGQPMDRSVLRLDRPDRAPERDDLRHVHWRQSADRHLRDRTLLRQNPANVLEGRI